MTDLEKFKIIKDRLNLNNEDFCKMFGYKNPKQLNGNNSSRAVKFKTGIVRFYEKIGEGFTFEGN